MAKRSPSLASILAEARACRHCEAALPLEPRPLLAASKGSRIVVIGQAPGRLAHDANIPWNDASGRTLRDWLGVSDAEFYDPALMAMMPMGFCYPGKGKGGDMPPRPECAPLWHERLLAAMPKLELTIFVGRYAFERYLGEEASSVTEAARSASRFLPSRIALPHPSPRNRPWLSKNPWFESEVLPALRARVREILDATRR